MDRPRVSPASTPIPIQSQHRNNSLACRATRPPPMPVAKRTRQRTRRLILSSTSSTRETYPLTPSFHQGKRHPRSAALPLRSHCPAGGNDCTATPLFESTEEGIEWSRSKLQKTPGAQVFSSSSRPASQLPLSVSKPRNLTQPELARGSKFEESQV